MQLTTRITYDFKEKIELERDFYKDKGWLSGISYLNHERFYKKDSDHIQIIDRYPVTNFNNDFVEGEEIYIDDNIDNVFIDPTAQNVVHLLTYCKTNNSIYTKVISFDIFTSVVIEFKNQKDSTGGYDFKIFENKQELEDFANEYYSNPTDYISSYHDFEIKAIPPYTSQFKDVYDSISGSKTNLDVWNTIKGKCLKVVKTTKVFTVESRMEVNRWLNAEYKYTTRDVTVPAFTFVDKDINKEIKSEHHYEPQYFISDHSGYKNYRIIVDEKTKLKGLMNLNTGKIICKCVFENISYFQHIFNVNNPPEILIKFTKFGKEAICELNKIDTYMRK